MKKRSIIILTSTVAVLTCALLSFSQIRFGSVNIPRIIYSAYVVNNRDEKYCVIKDDPSRESNGANSFFTSPKKVIMATTDNYGFSDYVEAGGYSVVDRFGSQVTIEKDGKSEVVYVQTNKYYSLWQWY